MLMCRDCGEMKKATEFYEGSITYCKECTKARQHWYTRRKKVASTIADRYSRLQEVKALYGDDLTPETRERMLDREDDTIRRKLREACPRFAHEVHDNWPFPPADDTDLMVEQDPRTYPDRGPERSPGAVPSTGTPIPPFGDEAGQQLKADNG